MKTIITLTILLSLSLFASDDVYSESNSYNINQTNINNTYNDKSQIFSNNSFALFGNIKRDYQSYMGGESLIYINANYDMNSYMNRKELVLKLGIYEEIYFMYGKGQFNQKSGLDNFDAEEYGYIEGSSVKGYYTITGLAYHFYHDKSDMFALEWYNSKFDKVTNSEYKEEYSLNTLREKNSVDASELDNSMFMLRYSYWKSGHTGLSLGMGIDNSGPIMSFGISLRYF